MAVAAVLTVGLGIFAWAMVHLAVADWARSPRADAIASYGYGEFTAKMMLFAALSGPLLARAARRFSQRRREGTIHWELTAALVILAFGFLYSLPAVATCIHAARHPSHAVCDAAKQYTLPSH
jgi:hypothetical protein